MYEKKNIYFKQLRYSENNKSNKNKSEIQNWKSNFSYTSLHLFSSIAFADEQILFSKGDW